jgi:hypothetical protein
MAHDLAPWTLGHGIAGYCSLLDTVTSTRGSGSEGASTSFCSASGCSELKTDAPPETAADDPDHKPATPAHTGFRALVKRLGSDIAHLPSRENLYTAVAGGALAEDLFRAQALRKSSWNR